MTVCTGFGVLESLKVTVLVEDYAGHGSKLLAQAGLSVLAECQSQGTVRRILFDTGASARPILSNMEDLGLEPSSIDLVVLSHCHSDHTGGLAGILEAAGKHRVPVIAHPTVFRTELKMEPSVKSIGMGPGARGAIEKAGGEMVLIKDPLKIMEGVVCTGEITRRTAFEETPTVSFLTLEGGRLTRDALVDDISLVFNVRGGLVILTGCSHAGVVSIVGAAKEMTRVPEVLAVIGGFHLVNADSQRIQNTVEGLSGVKKIYPGHCTGFKAEVALYEAFQEDFEKIHSAKVISF